MGGFLVHHAGWRAIFFLNVILRLVIIWPSLTRLGEDMVGSSGEGFDTPGAALYTVSLAAVIYGASAIASSPFARWSFPVGLAGLMGFVWQELRSNQPLLDIKLLGRNTVFAFSNLAALINYSATFSLGFLMSLYLQTIRGLDAQTAGFVLLSQPITMSLLSPLAGRLSDLVEPRLLASAGMALTTLGLFVFSLLAASTSIKLVAANLLLMGVGFALFSSPNTNAVMSSVEKRHYGVASSTLGTMRLCGQTFSMAMVTLVFSLTLGRAGISPEVAPLLMKGTRITFLIFTFFSLGGVFASLARGTLRNQTVR